METTPNKNIATLLQLSALTQYVFPFGNFIFPIVIWSIKKQESSFVDYNGKQAINFQLSLFMYSLILIMVAAPILLYTIFHDISFTVSCNGDQIIEEFSAGKITGIVMIAVISVVLLAAIKVVEFLLIIYAAVKNSNGENYNFPFTIKFLK